MVVIAYMYIAIREFIDITEEKCNYGQAYACKKTNHDKS